MERRLYKGLWQMRFQKMLKLEENAARDYEALLEECREKHQEHPIETHLEQLIHDELKHARLVQQLLKIVERQPE